MSLKMIPGLGKSGTSLMASAKAVGIIKIQPLSMRNARKKWDFSSVMPSIMLESMEKIAPHILLGAYAEGVFPMAEEGELLWFSPVNRGVIPLDDQFKIPRGLKKSIRKTPFRITMDEAFKEVMLGCADRESTWIDGTILESYHELHELGFAHSVECWDDDGLQGGLYGVKLGNAFFGESMFSRKTDASKIETVVSLCCPSITKYSSKLPATVTKVPKK